MNWMSPQRSRNEMWCDSVSHLPMNCFFSQHSKGCGSSRGCSWWDIRQWQQLKHNPGWLTQFHLWVHKTCPDHKILTPQTHEIRGPCLGYWWPNQGNWGHAIVFCLWTIYRGKFSIGNFLFLHILYKLWTLSPNQCRMWSLLPVNYLSRDETKITVSAFGEILSWWILVSGSWEWELFSSMPLAFEWRSSEELCLTTSLHASHTLLSQIHSPMIEDFFVSAAMLGWESHKPIFLLLSLLYSLLILFPFLFLFPSFFFLCLFPLDFGWGPHCVITAGFMIFSAQPSTVLELKACTPVWDWHLGVVISPSLNLMIAGLVLVTQAF